jgi:aconitase B
MLVQFVAFCGRHCRPTAPYLKMLTFCFGFCVVSQVFIGSCMTNIGHFRGEYSPLL